jgi:hypothetical protein
VRQIDVFTLEYEEDIKKFLLAARAYVFDFESFWFFYVENAREELKTVLFWYTQRSLVDATLHVLNDTLLNCKFNEITRDK